MNTNHKFAIQCITKEFDLLQSVKVESKYIVLHKAIKRCITKRALPDEWLLPPTRILSESMGLSRTTVLKAYDLLLLEKLVVSRLGSGIRVHFKEIENAKKSVVQPVFKDDHYPTISEKGLAYLKNIDLINRLPTSDVAFRPGLPPLDVFPVNQWKKLLNNYWRHVKSSGLAYSEASGLKELKSSIRKYLQVSRNVKCKSDQIVIVSGSLQSLYLIVNAVLNKGDSVILENPVFPNVHSVFKSSEAQLIPVHLDEQGMAVAQIPKQSGQGPKLVHITPANHYPTGVRMSLTRRQQLLEWASTNKALIIENDYEHEIANDIDPMPTVYSLDKEERTIYIGTFNRLLHPSIRLGYMVIPSYLKQVIEALQEHSHRFVSPSIQVVMNQFIERNYLYKHIEKSIAVAKERYAQFVQEFNMHCKTMYIPNKPLSSFHVIALFKNEATAAEERATIKKLNEVNITAFSLSKCYVTQEKQFGLILGYAAVRSTTLKRKIKTMATII